MADLPDPAVLAAKRAALRETLRKEFLKQDSSPYARMGSGDIFDPGFQRYFSMRATRYDYFVPTLNGFMKFFMGVIFPIGAFTFLIWKDKTEFERKCRNGENSYEDRVFKLH